VRRAPLRFGGADVGYAAADRELCAAVVALEEPDFSLLDSCLFRGPVPVPYRPGHLGEREAHAVLRALAGMRQPPEVLLVDGHGRAHPRKWGAACAVGQAAGLPTVGVAKDVLVGAYREPGSERGAWSPLVDRGEVVGAAVRTRTSVRPVFVSVGCAMELEEAISLVLRASVWRVPEPIREAHAGEAPP
jgi:deoxyribonuclease V